ncbi:uncharacterized protein LOC129600036 isoform X2 [Paramacrobiotus metropolitanus]|uniref:uncharacterized protein LOC129600036 isoform X2 n=1 Tax=Paramacrobiotus metropolitanus TaxID=2943436 RepID=UPI0024460F20|nr:uncharacterized protein LOC129600036 isoform X2 [Paramacrobiotus metropolitanus]
MNSWLLFLFAAAANGLKTTSTGSETDCSPQPIPLQNDQVAPGPPFPFRTDFLTEEECLVYGNHLQRNNPFWATRRCHDSSFNPRFFTYIPVKLSGSSDAVAATQKIRATSPTRAVTVTIDIGLIGADHSAEEALHTDVFEPIRQQVVQLFRKACNTPDAIHKIYNVGLLPSLIRLELKFCYNMTIKKRDFAHMPQLRIFEAIDSSIAEIEAHTFTDLVNLRSLMLERDISYHLSAYTDKTGPMSFYTIHNDADVERVRRLHCDCSYAWLRNFHCSGSCAKPKKPKKLPQKKAVSSQRPKRRRGGHYWELSHQWVWCGRRVSSLPECGLLSAVNICESSQSACRHRCTVRLQHAVF